MAEYTCHLPRGRCGLKCCSVRCFSRLALSPSARKVWIEIIDGATLVTTNNVTFREEGVDWNLCPRVLQASSFRHLPRGRCGLKLCCWYLGDSTLQSPSARKVWIEITNPPRRLRRQRSPSARKVWIEIKKRCAFGSPVICHLPRGRCGLKSSLFQVPFALQGHLPRGRCGLKWLTPDHPECLKPSPSARKVWIEMFCMPRVQGQLRRHLPRGRCGLKFMSIGFFPFNCSSPSARKVWIEILSLPIVLHVYVVTFREEGVDWNSESILLAKVRYGHLPRGRCGLKCQSPKKPQKIMCHLPRGRCGLKLS